MDVHDELLSHWLECPKARADKQPVEYIFSSTRQKHNSSKSSSIRTMIDSVEPVAACKGKLAFLWGAEGAALSDTLLRVMHLPSAKGETAEQLEAKQQSSMQKDEYRLHSVVLASGSGYFKQRLLSRASTEAPIPPLRQPAATNAHSQANQCSDEGDEEDQAPAQPGTTMESQPRCVYFLEERLAPSDTSAARAVLRHIYTEQLTFESPCQLVSILKIADKWKAQDTIDAGRAAFSQLKPEDLDLDVIKQVYSLDGILRDAQNFADLVNMVQNRLVTMFQDIVEVVQNPASRSMFQQLPFAAVMALLRSSQLIVDSEDTVVVAANLWVTSGKGRNTTTEQRKILAGVINLAGLSPAYLCGVLPNLRWFTPPGQAHVSWTHVMPAPYFAEMQLRLVSPRAKQVLGGTGNTAQPTSPTVQANSPTTSDARNNKAGSASQSNPPPTAAAGARPAAANARVPSSNGRNASPPRPAAADAPAASTAIAPAFPGVVAPLQRVLRDQNLEIECDIDFARLKQYIEDGYNGLKTNPQGFRGIHVHSQCSYFKGFMWGIKLVFGFSSGFAADGAVPTFTVTPSPFASLPPGEDGIRPLNSPINVSFRCTMEGVGSDKAGTYATATYQGASFLRPGEDHVSSIGIANFFKRVPQQHSPDSWLPFLVESSQKTQFLRLRLRVMGNTVE